VSATTVSFRFGLAIMLEGPDPCAFLRACSVAQDHHAHGPSVSSANKFPTAMLVRAHRMTNIATQNILVVDGSTGSFWSIQQSP
jgi:hypothetical protein